MSNGTRILLECIVASMDDVEAAMQGGADRFELCSALALGGLTPSIGLLRHIKQHCEIPVMAMLRPREGGMHYSEREFQTMLEDAAILLEHGADGIVFGFLNADGTVDRPRCEALLKLIQSAGKQSTFHRAFDVVPDPEATMSQLIELGVNRILTSGQEATAEEGMESIARYIELAQGRITILPGGGLHLGNMRKVLERTQAKEVHMYLTRLKEDSSVRGNPKVYFGAHLPGNESELHVKDAKAVLEARRLLDDLAKVP